jgi:acetoin utilization deacetylase AcuC-like enzyme
MTSSKQLLALTMSPRNQRSCFSTSFTIANKKTIDHNDVVVHRRLSTTIRKTASFFSSSAVLLSSSYCDSIYLPPTLTRVNEEIQARNEDAAIPQQKHGASYDDSSSIASKSNHEQQPPPPITTKVCSDSIYIDNGLLAERLGLNPKTNKRHAPMVYHEQYSNVPNWPSNHTFPMAKFEQTAYSLLNDVDDYLLNAGVGSGDDYFVDDNHWNGLRLVLSPTHFYRPLSLSKSIPTCLLSPPIDSNYLNRFLSGSLTNEECRIIGFREHTSQLELINRTVLEVTGTVLAAQLAIRYGLASNVAGGTHHAQCNQGRGFCILNDLAIVTRLMTWTDETDSTTTSDGEDVNLLLRGLYRGNTGVSIERVLVVDCDVHQGDGTATFAYPNVEDSLHGKLFTLDLHAKDNFPLRKEQCTYDIGLPDECNDEMYLAELSTSLNVALAEVQPQLVLYNAGVDIYKMDKLGRLSVSTDGMERRDTHVIRTCIDNNIPVACVVGGGYDNDVAELGRRHALVHRVCAKIWRERQMWKRSIV